MATSGIRRKDQTADYRGLRTNSTHAVLKKHGGPKPLLRRQSSNKMVPRDQRNDSPWSSLAPRLPPIEDPARDSLSDDIFFRAYYDPVVNNAVNLYDKLVYGGKKPESPSFKELETQNKKGKTPEDPFDIILCGHSNVGKKTFMRKALGMQDTDVPPQIRPFKHAGETYYIRVRERKLDDLDVDDPKTIERAVRMYEASEYRHDASLLLYDVTRKESLRAVPMTANLFAKAGVPCLMAPTKTDRSITLRQLDPEAVEKKTELVVGKAIKATRKSAEADGERQCFTIILDELLQRASSSKASTPRPRSKSSLPQLPPIETTKHTKSTSESSLAPNIQEPSANEIYPFARAQTPSLQQAFSEADIRQQELRLDRQNSASSEPFSPRTFQVAAASLSSPIIAPRDESPEGPTQEKLAELPSHILDIATFEELVARVCFRDNQESDVRFDFNFLVFYRFFASPLRLLKAVISVYVSAMTEEHCDENTGIVDRVLQFLSQWVTMHPGDFATEETQQCLDDFLDKLDQNSGYFSVAEQIRMASGKIEEDDDQIWALPDAVQASAGAAETPTMERIRSNDTDVSLTDLDAQLIFKTHSTLTLEAKGPTHTPTNSVDQSSMPYGVTYSAQRQSALLTPTLQLPFTKVQWRQLMSQPEEFIARELTRIDWIMFSAIQPRDMIRHITVREKERSNFRSLANVTRMIDHFNHIAYWTTNLILLRDKPKHRAQALEKLILVARKLRELNNYNSLGAVIAGIHGTSVHRLAATRELVPIDIQKNFLKLEVLMSTQKGHASYRLAWENSKGPRIPFLPLHRRDLVVAEQGNKTWIPIGEGDDAERRINWNKFNVLGNLLWDLHEAQSTPYNGFVISEVIKSLILDGGIIKDDDKLYDRSVFLEPTGSSGSGAGLTMRRLQPWLARYGIGETK